MNRRIIPGNCMVVLPTLDAESVHTCVTSPPYWALRDYKIPPSVWGGSPDCEHEWGNEGKQHRGGPQGEGGDRNTRDTTAQDEVGDIKTGRFCSKCGAWLGCLGLEPTPELFVEHIVMVFREVRRVLRKDGTIWVNLGDSYTANAGQRKSTDARGPKQCTNSGSTDLGSRALDNLPAKNLVGIPWRVAFALQADGWYLRSEIIWHKPNPMPESVADRPTKSHEHIFLLTKSDRYYYDAKAIMEPVQSGPSDVRKMNEKRDRIDAKHFHSDAGPLAAANHRKNIGNKRAVGGTKIHGNLPGRDDGARSCNDPEQLFRNKRDVWTVGTSTYDGAHFATFPPALITPCILAGCPVGGTVLDPFGGSGTTGEVAETCGRNSILIELNPDYIAMQKRRTAQGGLLL